MKHRLAWLLLAVLLLAGCTAPAAEPLPAPTGSVPEPITEPELVAEPEPVTELEPVTKPEPEPTPPLTREPVPEVLQPTAPVYLFYSDSHQVAVSPTGEALGGCTAPTSRRTALPAACGIGC